MKISKEQIIEWWMDDITGQLEPTEKKLLESYLEKHPDLRNELSADLNVWEKLDDIETPEPGEAMTTRFQGMLDGYVTAQQGSKSNWYEGLLHWLNAYWKPSLASMCIGLLIGLLIFPTAEKENLGELTQEVTQMKRLLVLSMIEKPQAQERIKAVSLAENSDIADDRILASLFHTLNQDQSINVRLAALEALVKLGQKPEVRKGLIESILKQESALLQVALADAMILLQEPQAINEFNELLERKTLNDGVQMKLESTIETLKTI